MMAKTEPTKIIPIKNSAEPAPKKERQVVITRPDMRVAEFAVRGTAPYVQNKFSEKARAKIHETQKKGTQARSKTQREAKNFQEVYEAAMHRAVDGWHGIPASAFRSAMIRACVLVGFHMTKAKLTVFVIADGYGTDGTPLVRIHGEPEYFESYARNDNGSCDLRARPMWREWTCKLRVTWDEGQFSDEDLTNLLFRAGLQVGIGEGRPDSKDSNGCGWGTFAVE